MEAVEAAEAKAHATKEAAEAKAKYAADISYEEELPVKVQWFRGMVERVQTYRYGSGSGSGSG